MESNLKRIVSEATRLCREQGHKVWKRLNRASESTSVHMCGSVRACVRMPTCNVDDKHCIYMSCLHYVVSGGGKPRGLCCQPASSQGSMAKRGARCIAGDGARSWRGRSHKPAAPAAAHNFVRSVVGHCQDAGTRAMYRRGLQEPRRQAGVCIGGNEQHAGAGLAMHSRRCGGESCKLRSGALCIHLSGSHHAPRHHARLVGPAPSFHMLHKNACTDMQSACIHSFPIPHKNNHR